MHLRNISLTSSNLIAKKFYSLMVCQDQPNHYLDQLLDLLKNVPDATSKSYR